MLIRELTHEVAAGGKTLQVLVHRHRCGRAEKELEEEDRRMRWVRRVYVGVFQCHQTSCLGGDEKP